MSQTQQQNLADILSPLAKTVQADIERWLCPPATPQSLAQAMQYCVLGGGKRLRPALVLLAAKAAGGSENDELARRCAVAIELVHCYSLVHDDLPAMDNDMLRRGLPTAHVKFGQAMAILAGDALLTRAFGVLAEGDAASNCEKIAKLVAELAGAAGECGMIAGQVADMDLCEVPQGAAGLDYIHARKTAILISCACKMGGICASANAAAIEQLGTFGLKLGLAFQLVDDLLDVTAKADTLGKTPGKDAAAGKRTHLSVMDFEAACKLAQQMTDGAIAAISPLGEKSNNLAELAKLLTSRTH